MKIALILATAKNDPLIKREPFMPLSLPLLAAAAPMHEYIFINMLDGKNVNFDEKYDLVGISSRATAEKTAFKIADEFKKRNIPVVMGGPQISSNPYQAKEHAVSVVIGEGEELWPILLKDFQNKKLKDFYVSSPKKFNAKKHSVFQINSYLDLKKVPIAKREIYKKHYSYNTVFAARGCSIGCDFCSVPELFGTKLRTRPIADVVSEIKTFKGYYYLLDDNVFGRSGSYDYYLSLYEEILKLKSIKYWTGQGNLEAAGNKEGRQVIKKAAEAGLVYAAIGMESINPKVLKKSGVLKKNGVKNEKDVIAVMKENISFIQEQGIIVTGWFTMGYEEDTIETFYQTLEFCLETNVIPVINALEALSGTRLYDRLLKEKRISNKKAINIIHPYLKDEEVFKALKEINKKGYSFPNIMRRTGFYFSKFKKGKTLGFKDTSGVIHKTMFSFFLEQNIKKGLISYTNAESFFN